MKKNQIGLIGLPYDKQSSFLKGQADAPPLIRRAFESYSTNKWTESGIDLGREGLIVDNGDVVFTEDCDPLHEIEDAVRNVLDLGMIPVSLGGDHAISYPAVKAIQSKYPGLNILHFDAHPDLYDELEGNRYSHACPFARIMEEGLADRLVQVGIRTVNGHQREQAERFGVEIMEMKGWKDDAELLFEGPLYISVDLDVLDPAFAPGVSHYEPGGMTTRQVIHIIQNIEAPEFIGADIVEYNPQRDIHDMTAMVCAKIMKEIVSRMLV